MERMFELDKEFQLNEYVLVCPKFDMLFISLDPPLLMAVQTTLVALIAFMRTNPNGALGSLDYKKEERRCLAIRSRGAVPKFGTSERQRLILEYMLSKIPPVPQLATQESSDEHPTNAEGEAPIAPLDGDNIAAPDESDKTPAEDRLTLERSMPMQVL
ncbi:hypothetical protein IFM89_032323 [Coptis chinensis]|uniref:Uncharacterized protein n=1 Tax=Coptis chinensis TaxID=261450 RepID=A0A835IF33_9MAGN|nr:hypothetical protein IFM89_032323 [Coptis chinensis]